MLRFLGFRLLSILPTLLGVVSLVFLLIHLVPGDPIDVLLGEFAQPVARDALREKLGLNLSLWQQYIQYLSQVLVGDLGVSLRTGEPVTQMILARLPATITLATSAMSFALICAIPLGIVGAWWHHKWPDSLARVVAVAAFSMPSFWLGPVLIFIFAVMLHWLPVGGYSTTSSVILPAITLGLAMMAVLARLLRNTLLEALLAPFVRTVQAKGGGAWRCLQHALRLALLSVLTIFFLQLGVLLTGAILTEAVFAWPGVGNLLVEGLHARDYPLIQGVILFIAVVYTLLTLLAEIVTGWLNPQVRVQGGQT